MVKSMTGFGAARGASGKMEITVELKSVNNRYLDCSVKIPRVYMSLEEPIKAVVQKSISRGKVDVYVSIDTSKADDVEITVNRPLAAAYISALRSMAKEFSLSDNITAMDLTKFPDVLQANKQEADIEQLASDICCVLEAAVSDFEDMRSREGAKLSGDISARLCEIEKLAFLVEEASPRSVAEYRKKLETRMSEILQTADVDQTRILTEAALFADRVAVNEEIVRLRSHVDQLRELLKSPEPVGRKIDFLVQEFNREANTIGSKGNDTEMSKVVVDLKAEIEKIREQAQNIE